MIVDQHTPTAEIPRAKGQCLLRFFGIWPLALVCFILPLATGPSIALAQSSSSSSSSSDVSKDIDACTQQIHIALAREQLQYRGVLFGVKKAADETLGTTRYDKEGTAWIKTAEDEWKSAEKPGVRPRDDHIDRDALLAPRRGIFETRQVLTNELVPPLIQSYRALGCRLASVCDAVRLSRIEGPPHLDSNGYFVSVKVPGCIPMLSLYKPFSTCGATVTDEIIRGHCDDVGNQILAREADLLKVSVSYDAAYRSLLQFAGNFDRFVGSFRVSLLGPIRQSVSLLGVLTRIPCFLSQCDK